MSVPPRDDVHAPSWRVLIVKAENRSSPCQRKPLGARLLVGDLSRRCPGTRGRKTRNYLDSKKIISKSHGSMSDGAAIFGQVRIANQSNIAASRRRNYSRRNQGRELIGITIARRSP